ncbi:MAG TPA: FKBP-type peptidyl-prolyl cis-trans isomerase [Cyclobacteriaceae bacterium]|nr:FKBP-type peptidyl-prolyl cis-trans isomerase [Cyclobacteriaceae bacterium]
MKFLILPLLFCSALVHAQSKKELVAKTKLLAAEVELLKAQIEDLKKDKGADLSDPHKKASYALGVLVSKNLKMQGGDSLDYESLTIGIGDVFTNDSLQLQPQDAAMFVQVYMQQAMEAKIAKAKAEGLAFLAENKTKAGVTETPSGLQYKVISPGTGKKATATSQVTVHYTGKLIDGTPFDSSVERGEPATFGVNEVIGGWTEALQLMREGDKGMLYIPSELGYGEQGGGQIPHNSVLVFEVELIKVN